MRPRNQRDYRIGSALKTISDEHQGVTLLTNHHDRKAQADDFVDSVSGSHGLAGAADALIVIARPRSERAGELKLTGRDIPEAEYAVIFDGVDWAIDGADLGEAARKAAQIRLTANLGENPPRSSSSSPNTPRASEPRTSPRSSASKTRSPGLPGPPGRQRTTRASRPWPVHQCCECCLCYFGRSGRRGNATLAPTGVAFRRASDQGKQHKQHRASMPGLRPPGRLR